MAIQQTGEIDIEYLYYWYIYNGQWIGIRIAQGTKQQNLSTDTLGNLRIHAPSCSKQKKVCKLLSQIDYLIEKEGQRIDLLSSAKGDCCSNFLYKELLQQSLALIPKYVSSFPALLILAPTVSKTEIILHCVL